MALRAETPLLGVDLPRLGVDLDPAPVKDLRRHAKALGIVSMPWQEYALALTEATNPDGSFVFEELAAIVARQNGKSTMLAPLIRKRMEAGRRILHSAQDRIIPKRIFERVAESLRGQGARIRLANGQEEVALPNGGRYKIVAPKRGIRGNDADDLILDEIQEQEDFDFVNNDAKPTTTASDNRQIIYLGNAGSKQSVVLNAIKGRSGKDPILAYLEWSADMDLHHADKAGWAQANPGLGHIITEQRLETIYRSYLLEGDLEAWETQHLCRWVESMLPRLVNPQLWQQALRRTESPVRPAMGIGVSPDGSRASACLSWAQGDGSIGLSVLADVTGQPIDLDRFAEALKPLALKAGVQAVTYDPHTDKHLARYWPDAKPITGQDFANASERFVRAVETGQLRYQSAEAVTNDLLYVSRKATTGSSFIADRADPRRPITAALAAIRAVWPAAAPYQGPPTIYTA
jgi:hypothetical protein